MARDAEALHRMRVGVRRLRSVFTTFKAALVDEDVRELRDDLHWLQGVLGHCRDWDVFNAKNVLPLRDRLADDDRLQRFAELGAYARERAYDALEEALASRRYRAVHERMQALLQDPATAGTRWMRRRAGKFARRAIRKRLEKIDVTSDDLAGMPLGEIHELRKQIKKARYAIGFFRDFCRRKRTRRHLEQLALMQDLIGQMVDVRAGQELIGGLHPRSRPDRRALSTARCVVTGWMAANSADCRRRLGDAWQQYRSLKRLR